MTAQDSDSELAGKVAASLTPAVVHVPITRRGEQSSGFFDLATLYTLRAERPGPPPLPVRLPAPAQPRAVPARVPPAIERRVEPVVVTRRAARPQPIGWFAVFVTWLATTTLAGLAATQLPAHVVVRARAPLAAAQAPAPSAPVAAPSPPAASPPPSPVVPVAGPPVIALTDLPRALPPAVRSTRRSSPHAAAPSIPVAVAVASAAPAPAPAPAPSSPPAKAAPAPSPASTAGMSLDDLIRREVATEQKRLHAAPAP